MNLPNGTRFYLNGHHYEVIGNGERDGKPARFVRRLTKTLYGKADVKLRIPIRVSEIEKHASVKTEVTHA